jgi:RNA polymerase sigma-70 factor (ECF subfamily)
VTTTFAQLHRELHDDLCAWAELQLQTPLRERLEPDDLVQEVWSRACANFARFDPTQGSFRGWLFGIAYHVLKQQLRNWQRRWRREDLRGATPERIDDATSVASRLSRSERVTMLLERVRGLMPADRELVLYRGLEGLPHAEVAQRLGLTPENAETRWRRLREQLACDLPE